MIGTAIESPRLARLVRASEDGSGVERAWSEIRSAGLPLVEPIEGRAHEQLLTFVWRPRRSLRSASVYTPIAELSPDGTALQPAGSTGAWFRSFRLPASTRASYGFAPLRLPALTDPGRAWGRYFHALVPDPANARRVRFGPQLFLSEVALGEAGTGPWSAGARPIPGTEERRRLRSRWLGNSRTVWVALPPRFDPIHSDYNLLIIFDGPAYQDPIPARRIVTNLVAAGRLDPTVVVLIDNALGARDRDLSGNPAFSKFLATELVPWLADRYHLRSGPATTVLAGSSLGGLAAAHAALQYPDRFGLVLAQSGAFLAAGARGGGPPTALIDRYAASPRLGLRFYLDAGTHETIRPPGGTMSLLEGVRRMRDVLRRTGYDLAYREFEGGHDYACWRETLADGLLYLLGRPAGKRAGRIRPPPPPGTAQVVRARPRRSRRSR
jgi:enterochelin esterase family protein